MQSVIFNPIHQYMKFHGSSRGINCLPMYPRVSLLPINHLFFKESRNGPEDITNASVDPKSASGNLIRSLFVSSVSVTHVLVVAIAAVYVVSHFWIKETDFPVWLDPLSLSNSQDYDITCQNLIPSSIFLPLFPVAPVCKSGQKLTYGAAPNEKIHVSCDVDSDPKNVSFRWFFNDLLNEIKSFHSNDTRSIVSYVLSSVPTYGKLLCFAENRVGRQKDPCIFNIIPASMYQNVSLMTQPENLS